MKIIYGIDRLEYGQGISRVVIDTAEYFFRNGFDVKIICGECNYFTEVPIVRCKWDPKLHQSSIRDVLKILNHEEPNIFHSHYYPMDICGSLLNPRKTEHIMHAHGVAYLSLRYNLKGVLGYFRANMGEYIGAVRAKKIIAISKFIQNELINNFKIKKDKIQLISNSVNLNRFSPKINRSIIRKKYGVEDDEILLLALGSPSPIKGHDQLLDCFNLTKKLCEKNTIKLLLIGFDPHKNHTYGQKILEKINFSNKDGRIISPGLVDDKDLPKFFAAGDIFICTSKWESFCLPIAEAMASGKPIVSFDHTAISELISNQYNGFKVDYPNVNAMSNKLNLLISQPNLIKKFGINSRNIAEEKFSIDKNMDVLRRVYELEEI